METSVYFENIRKTIANLLSDAQFSIVVAVAWFTDKSLYKILVQKALNGVHIKVMVVNDLINNGIHGIGFSELESVGGKVYKISANLMHHKFCIIDGNTVLTGSYNWTNKANLSNHENITVTKNDLKLAGRFLEEFHRVITIHVFKMTRLPENWQWIRVNVKDDKCGFKNMDGNVVIPHIYDDCWMIDEGIFWVHLGDLRGVVSYLNAIPCDCVYLANVDWDDGLVEYAPFYTDDMLLVQRENKKYGFLNLLGEEIIPCIFDHATDFSNGKATIKINGKDGNIDKHGIIEWQ